MKKEVEVKSMNRHARRAQGKMAGVKLTGVQDLPQATHQVYWIPTKRKSRAGVEYTYYKKIIDKKKDDK